MSCYDINFKNFDFDKLKNIGESSSLSRVARIVQTDLHGSINRANFSSAEEAKKEMIWREAETNKTLKALEKISEEMYLLGFVGEFNNYLKETEEYLECRHQYTGNDLELFNIVGHYIEAADDPSSGWLKSEIIVYSNFMYNENRETYIKIASIDRD